MAALYRAEVRIGLKPGVTDPEGANAKKALDLLGFRGVREVHTVRSYAVTLEAPDEAEARKQVEAMCRRLLTNPVIHDYTVTLEKA